MNRMKFIVNQMPKNKKDCPFSEPSIVKLKYVCKMDKKQCNLDEGYPVICMSCRWLKIQ